MRVLSSSTEAIEAAKEATRQIFGNKTAKKPNDGWSDEEEAEEAGIAEKGARKRRNNVESGRIVASQKFRDDKAAQESGLLALKAKATVTEFKNFRTAVLTLGFNAEAETALATLTVGQQLADVKLSNDQLTAYIRARTGVPVPTDLKGKAALLGRVEQMRDAEAEAGKATKLLVKLGDEPEG